MSRQITQNAINAFYRGEKFNGGNTTVFVNPDTDQVVLRLHGNLIAYRQIGTRSVFISNAGWFSNTTKERLNGLEGVSISQRKGVWYLNGKEWDGTLTEII